MRANMFTVIFKKQPQSKSFHNQLVKARLYFVAHYLKLHHNQSPAIWTMGPTRPDPSKINCDTTRPNPTRPNPWMDPTHVQLRLHLS